MAESIRAVFLDVDNTLLDFDKCAESSSQAAAHKLGLALPAGVMDTFHSVSDPLWRSLQDGEITLDELYLLRWQRIFDILCLPYNGVAFEETFRLCLKDSCEPVEGAMELLEYLRPRYILCAASNGPHAQQLRRLELAGMLQYFDHCFISEEIGASKPQAAFFEACLARLPGVDPSACLMIGDSLSADVDGARNCGMKSCWFNKRRLQEPKEPPEHTVYSLSEIRAFL